ncbi:hypothetical protein HR060_09980 [Catenovulum sp. SM1970]|uniref:hypothetical protein n=1 Tax=Marinifaba aquimaris TaxID=2741323 RepID=UPI001571BCC0|nr:hypothetical protein [Marinifaba aquimaris]NTS77191.1 hypothetical protein [Marinifaba aquimaris]
MYKIILILLMLVSFTGQAWVSVAKHQSQDCLAMHQSADMHAMHHTDEHNMDIGTHAMPCCDSAFNHHSAMTKLSELNAQKAENNCGCQDSLSSPLSLVTFDLAVPKNTFANEKISSGLFQATSLIGVNLFRPPIA